MFKRIFIIINPASGREEPVLSYINKALHNQDIYWDIAITRKKNDAFNFAREALTKNYDLIAVYGGDGTVTEVAQALYLRKTPLLILPGGTANVMAKEIGIPMETQRALNLLKRKKVKLKRVDMALLDKQPFISRIDVGILAEVIKNTGRDTKEKFGRLAYSVSALKHVMNHDIYSFNMDIDGKKIQETGVALMVTNAGNIGISDFSVFPQVRVADGYLNVILFKEATAGSIFNWIRSMWTGKKPVGSVKHWKGKKIAIKFNPEVQIVCDDKPITVKSINVEVVPGALTLVVP